VTASTLCHQASPAFIEAPILRLRTGYRREVVKFARTATRLSAIGASPTPYPGEPW
jgi:hypothetical protein